MAPSIALVPTGGYLPVRSDTEGLSYFSDLSRYPRQGEVQVRGSVFSETGEEAMAYGRDGYFRANEERWVGLRIDIFA